MLLQSLGQVSLAFGVTNERTLSDVLADIVFNIALAARILENNGLGSLHLGVVNPLLEQVFPFIHRRTDSELILADQKVIIKPDKIQYEVGCSNYEVINV